MTRVVIQDGVLYISHLCIIFNKYIGVFTYVLYYEKIINNWPRNLLLADDEDVEPVSSYLDINTNNRDRPC